MFCKCLFNKPFNHNKRSKGFIDKITQNSRHSKNTIKNCIFFVKKIKQRMFLVMFLLIQVVVESYMIMKCFTYL